MGSTKQARGLNDVSDQGEGLVKVEDHKLDLTKRSLIFNSIK